MYLLLYANIACGTTCWLANGFSLARGATHTQPNDGATTDDTA